MNEMEYLKDKFESIKLTPEADERIQKGIKGKLGKSKKRKVFASIVAVFLLFFVLLFIFSDRQKDPGVILNEPTNTPNITVPNSSFTPEPTKTLNPAPTKRSMTFFDMDSLFEEVKKDEEFYNGVMPLTDMMKLDDSRIGVIELLEDNRVVFYLENGLELDLYYNTGYGNTTIESYHRSMEENKNYNMYKGSSFDYLMKNSLDEAIFLFENILVVVSGEKAQEFVVTINAS
ncbi:MAG TPA: hypothetical protein PKM70_12010 [Clostridia bacterium]|nr:hypothetical protein [Clostridia bacterium]